jgi:hypothetical protein
MEINQIRVEQEHDCVGTGIANLLNQENPILNVAGSDSYVAHPFALNSRQKILQNKLVRRD